MFNPYYNNNDDDDWKTSAMTHDSLVVDLLLHLKHTASRPIISSNKLVTDLATTMRSWGAKQLRSVSDSKSVSGCSRVSRRIRRCSPSTPLSWSGGSGGGLDGWDTSSLTFHHQSRSFRSKISLAGTEVNCAISSKHRKKKTYAELKAVEDMLLRERIRLNQELAMLGAVVEKHRAENVTLKRIKLNLNIHSMKNNNSCNLYATIEPKAASSNETVMKREEHGRVSFDLNIMPSELEYAN